MKDEPIAQFREIGPGVHCSLQVLSGIAEIAAEGFRRMRWGGVERGGLLFGRSGDNEIWVLEFRELESEHQFGPAFHLSSQDKERLAALRSESGPLAVVGWFRTTSRELELTDDDINLIGECFSQSSIVTLVLYRAKSQDSRFGVFTLDEQCPKLISQFTSESAQSLPLPPPKLITPAAAGPILMRFAPPAIDPANPAGMRSKAAPPAVPIIRVRISTAALDPPVPSSAPEPAAADWLSFFDLTRDPFLPAAEPDCYLETAASREAQAVLEYGITGRKGVILLTARPGLGKSTLLRIAAQRLRRKQIDIAYLDDPKLDVSGLYATLLHQFDLNAGDSKVGSFLSLQEHAIDRSNQGHNIAIIADDAHLLALEVLGELEVLNNIETRRGKLIQLVLAGGPELFEVLDSPSLAGLKQRILLRARLPRLTPQETADYLEYRLLRAGGRTNLFPPDTVRIIHQMSGGVPRLINSICASSMKLGFSENARTITRSIVERAAAMPGR